MTVQQLMTLLENKRSTPVPQPKIELKHMTEQYQPKLFAKTDVTELLNHEDLVNSVNSDSIEQPLKSPPSPQSLRSSVSQNIGKSQNLNEKKSELGCVDQSSPQNVMTLSVREIREQKQIKIAKQPEPQSHKRVIEQQKLAREKQIKEQIKILREHKHEKELDDDYAATISAMSQQIEKKHVELKKIVVKPKPQPEIVQVNSEAEELKRLLGRQQQQIQKLIGESTFSRQQLNERDSTIIELQYELKQAKDEAQHAASVTSKLFNQLERTKKELEKYKLLCQKLELREDEGNDDQ